MKKILFVLFGIITGISAKAQFVDSVKSLDPTLKIHYINTPEFPGGPDNMNRWVANNVRRPEQAKKDHVKGIVKVGFIVYEDGSLNEVNIVQSLSKETDEEAIRLISVMPKWKPGGLDNKLNKYRYTLSVKF
jgi:protein TonB